MRVLTRWATAGMLVISTYGIAYAESPMHFRIASIDHGKEPVVIAQGEIDKDTVGRLEAVLASDPDLARHPTVLLASRGGTILGAVALGRYLRRIHATTIVATAQDTNQTGEGAVRPNFCIASCVYAFLGGTRRILPSRSVLGITRMRYEGPGEGGSIYGQVVGSLSNYIQAMGIPASFADYCEQQPDGALHVLTGPEIRRWRLAEMR